MGSRVTEVEGVRVMAGALNIRIPRIVAPGSGAEGNQSARFCAPQSSGVRPARRTDPKTGKATRSSRQSIGGLSSAATPAGPRVVDAATHSTVVRARDVQRCIWRKIAEYKKAVVTGIGSSAAVLLAVKEPLGSLLPGFATHWMMAYAMAAATVYATYRATNAKPEKPAEREVAAGTKTDELAAGESQPELGWALAGVAFVLGGAILARRNWGRRMQPVVPYTMLLPHGGSPPGPWMPS
jgi:hypothetical protein